MGYSTVDKVYCSEWSSLAYITVALVLSQGSMNPSRSVTLSTVCLPATQCHTSLVTLATHCHNPIIPYVTLATHCHNPIIPYVTLATHCHNPIIPYVTLSNTLPQPIIPYVTPSNTLPQPHYPLCYP